MLCNSSVICPFFCWMWFFSPMARRWSPSSALPKDLSSVVRNHSSKLVNLLLIWIVLIDLDAFVNVNVLESRRFLLLNRIYAIRKFSSWPNSTNVFSLSFPSPVPNPSLTTRIISSLTLLSKYSHHHILWFFTLQTLSHRRFISSFSVSCRFNVPYSNIFY